MSEESPNTPEAPDRRWREWMMVAVGITGVLALLAVIVSLAALSSSSSTNTTTVTVASRSSTPAAAVAKPTSFYVAVKADDEHGRMGPDKQWHDAFLPAEYTVHPGQTVTMTFQNYDSGPHTFTAPSLNVNQVIPSGSASHPTTTTVTFTAPKTPGKYQWWCAVPCDPWAMSHNGYMRGYVTVVS